MNTCIYDKTDKGREEIATRKYHVAPKLRALLVMIDGRNPLDALMKNFSGMGLTEDSVSELLLDDYITLVGGAPEPAPAPAPRAAAAELSAASLARAKMAERSRLAAARLAATPAPAAADDFDLDELVEQRTVLPTPVLGAVPVAPTPTQAAAPAAAVFASDAERFRALYDFYNQTIKSAIGLRGFTLQLKVEKAGDLEAMRALRLPYLQAVYKSKGSEMVRSLRDRLDHLLGGKPAVDDFFLPGG